MHWLERPPFSGAEYLGASGCDQVLLWPRINRALLVWHFYHASLGRTKGGVQGLLNRCAEGVEALSSDLRRFAQSNLRLSGLLLFADLDSVVAKEGRHNSLAVALEPGPRIAAGAAVNAILVPPDVDAWPRFATDFSDGLCLVLEELLT